jgi:hypothetical protein
MSMVTVTLIDAAATRATELAHARGVSEDTLVAELVLQAPFPDQGSDAGLAALEGFFGCGTSNEPQLTVKEMRRDLAARRLADGIENL